MPWWRNWYTRMLQEHVPARDCEFESRSRHIMTNAAVAELVYAPVLGTGSRKGLRVRVSPAAHERNIN